ncbi:MAG: radical SAM family heme chaperone HemW [Thermodesulfobacteriota bacterium]|nr:radical SAM family heme chaperone HemW [Thermodesulfobacteriota bacterium]
MSWEGNLPGLYVHVPFCRKKCAYCDFYSVTVLAAIPAFVQALRVEMQLRSRDIPGPFGSLYIGGGTPSVLPGETLATIVHHARNHFTILNDAEITVEANPESMTPAWLEAVRGAGANRLNIGVQSFDDTMLAFLGRLHTAAQARQAVDMARGAGFDNIGLDLIYGIPGQTPDHIHRDLDFALAMAPAHLACYMLTYEDDTPLTLAMERGDHRPPSESLTAGLFRLVSDVLIRAGFVHYEISNFAWTPAHMATHNAKYWRRVPYTGFGPAAHSYTGRQRSWNVRDIDRYIETLTRRRRPLAAKETLTREQHMLEAVYLGLRTAAGIEIATFNKEFTENFERLFAPVVSDLQSRNLLVIADGRCFLTADGMQFHEAVATRFYNECL